MTWYISAVQKQNAAVLLRKPGRLASQYAKSKEQIAEEAGLNADKIEMFLRYYDIREGKENLEE